MMGRRCDYLCASGADTGCSESSAQILENPMKIARRLTISAALAVGAIAGLPLIAAANGTWVG